MAVVAVVSVAPEAEVSAAPEVVAHDRVAWAAPEVRVPAALAAHDPEAPEALIPVVPEAHGRADSSVDFITTITGRPWGLPHRGALTVAAVSAAQCIC